ncbi:MAG TPA: hypothetical protein VHT92_10935 [Candidatus Cybelea sp.]|jgi:hypothetical protein|nr:hypothetical protein [Candidatus Cybelea sp.]
MALDEIMRPLTAAPLVGVAALAVFWENFFGEIAGYFTRVAGRLSWMEKLRLLRVIEARQEIETVPASYRWTFAVIALVLAALELSPAVPFIVPFAIMSVALACGMLGVYIFLFRRCTPRAATLARRSVFRALPAPVLAALAGSFLITLALALTPGHRFEGIAIALTVLVIAIVSWRIAVAPTLLLGLDPEWEYVVDERLRIGRARAVVALGCVIASLFATVTAPLVAARYAEWIPLLATACTVVAAFENARLQWQEVHPA